MYIQGKNIKTIRILSLKGLKTLTACIIALAMVFSQISVNALATEQVSYYDRDTGNTRSVSAEVVTKDLIEWGEADKTTWYVVKGNITQNNVSQGVDKRIKVTGDVHLILADNAVLTANPGIEVSEENSLTIYAQTKEVTSSTGKIIAETQGNPDSAAIGGNTGKACGTIKITGGNISVSAYNGAAIGGGQGGSGGTITITGGAVNVNSVSGAAGIGGGENGNGGTITIDGGAVTAHSNSQGAAIGGGANGDGGTITINGGEVNADSVSGAAGIGGGLGITGGLGGTITINGGVVNARSTSGAAGIGGSIGASGGTITINGGVVNARAEGENSGDTSNGAVIGAEQVETEG